MMTALTKIIVRTDNNKQNWEVMARIVTMERMMVMARVMVGMMAITRGAV